MLTWVQHLNIFYNQDASLNDSFWKQKKYNKTLTTVTLMLVEIIFFIFHIYQLCEQNFSFVIQ